MHLFQRLLARVGLVDDVATALEEAARDVQYVAIVVDYENARFLVFL